MARFTRASPALARDIYATNPRARSAHFNRKDNLMTAETDAPDGAPQNPRPLVRPYGHDTGESNETPDERNAR